MKWRKWNNILHRDLGYLCVGLTLVYVVSGVAVNHVADWNPNYSIEQRTANVGPVTNADPQSAAVIGAILDQVSMPGDLWRSFRPDRETLRIFTDAGTVTVAGAVLGISRNVVTPPLAQARLAVCRSSLWVKPGWRKCT